MENPATWTQAEWVVQEAIRKAQIGRNEGRVGLSMTRQVTDALREAGLLDKDLPSLNVFSPPQEIPAERPRPMKVNGRPIPPEIIDGPAGAFARFCGETDPTVLAILDAEEEVEDCDHSTTERVKKYDGGLRSLLCSDCYAVVGTWDD